MKATMSDGFEIGIREEALDDWDFLEMLEEVDDGGGSIVKVAKVLLGDEGLAALKQHIRERDGRVSVQVMVDALAELMESVQTVKN